MCILLHYRLDGLVENCITVTVTERPSDITITPLCCLLRLHHTSYLIIIIYNVTVTYLQNKAAHKPLNHHVHKNFRIQKHSTDLNDEIMLIHNSVKTK